MKRIQFEGKTHEFPDDFSDADISAALSSAGPASKSRPTPGTGNVIGDVVAGIGAGVNSTLVGAYDLARKIPGVSDVLPEPNEFVRRTTEAPPSFAGKAGKFVEQAAEFAVPASRVGKLSSAASLPARAALQGVTAGGVAGVQSGGDPSATLTGAALGGAATLIPAAVGAGVRAGKRALENASPETVEMVKDLGGIALPRAKRAADLFQKLKGALFKRIKPADAEATESPASRVVKPEGYSGSPRSDFRQSVVEELNAPPPAPAVTAPPMAGPRTLGELASPRRAPAQAMPEPSPVASSPEPSIPALNLQRASGSLKIDVNRDTKAKAMAEFLHMNGEGIDHATALRMNPREWSLAARGAAQMAEGVTDKAPSAATVRSALAHLENLEKAKPKAKVTEIPGPASKARDKFAGKYAFRYGPKEVTAP